jgi:uncharacterized protein (TIGR02145 family)
MDAAIGATWRLADTRETDNPQTYTVRMLQDGHIWMVQDMKFGNLCSTNFGGSTSFTGDQTGKVSSTGIYYGDCRENPHTNSGYLYDWAAAINKAGAYQHSTLIVGCSGTGANANACQGICPEGWHIPTGSASGEFDALHNIKGCVTTNSDCWNPSSDFEGIFGGYSNGSGYITLQDQSGYYWSSTIDTTNAARAYYLSFSIANSNPTNHNDRNCGRAVRCVRNY